MDRQLREDYDLARELHKELNGYEVEPFPPQRIKTDPDSIAVSDEDEMTSERAKLRARSRSFNNNLPEVSTANQQAISIQKERKSRLDFYMPQINTFVDLNINQEWRVIENFESNLQMCFDRMQKQFFGKWLNDSKFIVKWDKTGVISDGSSFKIFESHKEVQIKSIGMIKPRVQLVSVLMHVLIHIYLKEVSQGAIAINSHDENFRKIMLHLNDTLNMKISTVHKFLFSPDQADYPTQWYQCTGICSAYEPFHGIIRCTSIPDESHTFFKAHDDECSGQFFRVFEMSRKNTETDVTENAYVRNTRYMFPKTRAAGKTHKVNQQVREILDLTDDSPEGSSVVIQNLCDVINLDDSDYANDDIHNNELVEKFIRQPFLVFSKCPFCTKIIGTTLLADHFDKCRGFQQKVIYKVTRK